jgi:hypothetical protein
LRVSVLLFRHHAGRWYILCESANSHSADNSIEVAWQKIYEQLTTKMPCDGCDTIIRVGEPCPPCRIRKLIATKECVVCKDDKHNFYELLCGHSFCKTCIKLIKPQLCPLCRVHFQLNDGMMEMRCDCDEEDDDMMM